MEEWKESASGALLVGVLAVLAGFYAWRQVRMLRRLGGSHGLSDEESRWRRGQAWRRLSGCALMLALAALLAWAVFMGPQAHRIAWAPEAATPDNLPFVRVYIGVWIGCLVLLMGLILLAAADIWSTRRFSVRQQRKILDARRAMLEREVARMRQGRNGHG